MEKAYCNVSIASIRQEISENSPQISQLLYGEICNVLELKGDFAKINGPQHADGWIDKRHLTTASAKDFPLNKKCIVTDNFGFHKCKEGKLLLSIGSEIENHTSDNLKEKNGEAIAKTALEFVNVPYLLGGRSFFGVDESGFVQLVFKVHGISLPKNIEEMSKLGESLFFMGEAEAGDLAFFADEDGNLVHVGIMLNSCEILHTDEKVRIDSIDSTGIYNKELKKHTFLLRVVKRILPD